ncbi:MAG: hypothetical protein HS111_03700 [Kofleriaceae bacterium]|nr:hypothetical protein [Kofleriaceae bacterium]
MTIMVTTGSLVGSWMVDPEDDVALARFGNVVIRFAADGALTYTIRGDGKDQIVLLRYRVEGDELISNQPSAPRQERTRFRLASDGRLVLQNEGFSATFVRRSEAE